MRLFLAIDVDAAVKAAVAAWMDRLTHRLGSSRATDLKLVDPRLAHLTLRFFGGVDPRRAQTLEQALARPWPVEGFDLSLDRAGTFPPRGHPRVVWLGVADGGGATAALSRAVQVRVRDAGFEDPSDDRPFSPHLTIGRVRHTARPGIGPELGSALAVEPPPAGSWRVDYLTLYESFLSPHGPRYEVRGVFRLP